MSSADTISHLERLSRSLFLDASSCLIFTPTGLICCSHNCTTIPEETAAIVRLFTLDHDAAIAEGVDLDGTKYDVHRYYDNLIYGRQATTQDVAPEESTGIAICRVVNSILDTPCYVLITYDLPNVSAKMVTLLRDFCQQHVSRKEPT